MTGTTTSETSVTGLKLWPVSYGAPARQKLLELIDSAKTEDPLAQVTVITTDGAGMGVLRRLTEVMQTDAPGDAHRGLIAVSAVNLSVIAEKVLERDPQRLAKQSASDLMLGGAIREVLATETGLFAGVKNHPATEQALSRVVKELSDLTNDQLGQVKKCSTRAAAVVGLYERVREELGEHNFYFRADVLKQAAKKIGAERVTTTKTNTASAAATAIKHLGTVVLYLPVELKNHQSELVKALASHTSVHVVAGLTGDDEDDEQYARLCARLGIVTAPSNEASPVSDASSGAPQLKAPVGDRIVSVSDADEEVRWVVRAVLRNLVDGVPAKRIAILYPVGVPYARLVAAQLDRAEVGWYGSGLQRLSESVVGRFASGLAELIGTDVPRAAVFEVLSDAPVLASPATASSVPASSAPTAPVSAWERIARAAHVVGGNDWKDLLERYAEELESRREQAASQEGNEPLILRLTAEIQQCEQLRDFVKGLKDDLDQALKAETWEEFSDWFKSVLARYLAVDSTQDRPDWQKTAAEEVNKTLGQLKGLDEVESGATPEVMCRALLGLLNQPVRNRTNLGKGVFIGLLDSGMDLSATHVYVLGMAEGTCPTRSRPDSMITEEERKSLGGALAVVADQVSKQHHELQAVLAGTRSHQGTTTLLYARGDLRNSANSVPSRWLLNTAKALESSENSTENPTRNSTDGSYFAAGYLDEENLEDAARDASIPGLQTIPSFTGGLLATDFPATRQEFDATVLLDDVGKTQHPFQRVSKHELCQPGSALASGIGLTAGRRSSEFTRFDGNLAGLSPSEKARLKERALGGAISASALETWASCPRAYLFGRLLGVSPIEEPELLYRMSPLVRGNIVHSAIDTLLRKLLKKGEAPGPDRPYTATDAKELSEHVGKLLDEQSMVGLGGHAFYAELDRQRIQDDMAEFLGQDESRGFIRGTVIASEHRFGLPRLADDETSDVPIVSYELANGEELKLRGSIDRVERFESDGQNQLLVIDYKTGSSNSFRNIERNPTMAGTKLQLAVYAIAAANHFKAPLDLDNDWSQAVAGGVYWFISTEPGGWESSALRYGSEIRQEVDDVLNLIVTGITEGMFAGYVTGDDRPGARYCAFCSPDGLSTRDLRKQWEAKRDESMISSHANLAEPAD